MTPWLPVKQRIIFKILLFTYKALKALAPQYLSDFLVHCKPPRVLHSPDKKLLQVSHFNLKTYGGRLFSYIALYLWNQLPDAIRQAPSLVTFKSNLKTYLFDQVFNKLLGFLLNTLVFLVNCFYLFCFSIHIAVQQGNY